MCVSISIIIIVINNIIINSHLHVATWPKLHRSGGTLPRPTAAAGARLVLEPTWLRNPCVYIYIYIYTYIYREIYREML